MQKKHGDEEAKSSLDFQKEKREDYLIRFWKFLRAP